MWDRFVSRDDARRLEELEEFARGVRGLAATLREEEGAVLACGWGRRGEQGAERSVECSVTCCGGPFC